MLSLTIGNITNKNQITVIMTELIHPPIQSETERYNRLIELIPGDSILIPEEEQRHYSRVASIFHRITDKRFRTSRKGQPEGKARVWRIK